MTDFIKSVSPVWQVSYVYNNPCGAGPFRGKTTLTGDKPAKGDFIYGLFGAATIKTVSREK